MESYLKECREEDLDITSSRFEQAFDSIETISAPTQAFYVCFSNCGDYVGRSFIKKNFTHVFVMERIPLGFIIHDPNMSALDTYILPDTPTEEFLASFMSKRSDYTILEVIKRATNREQHLIRFGLQSCVTIVAYILGIKLPWYCWTPYRLYKRIMKMGDGIISVRRLGNV